MDSSSDEPRRYHSSHAQPDGSKLHRMSKRQCPRCGRHDYVHRSRTRNSFERFLRTFFRIRPYRCADCNLRFFAFGWRSTVRSSTDRDEDD